MEIRERRVAQIVRDFFEAHALTERVGTHLRAGDLDFPHVNRLVAEGEHSTLYRLKEECHALFRQDLDAGQAPGELHAEELFDLAVGALFHEAMRFRESYYLTTMYGPRLDRMIREGTASGSLATAFRRVFESGHRRMLESFAETLELLRETREQLRTVLRHLPRGGVLARCLVENRTRTEEVFGVELPQLLEELFGSAAAGYALALESLVEHGHFVQALALLQREDVRECNGWGGAESFVEALDHYYGGELDAAVDLLARWHELGAPGAAAWVERARAVLEGISAGNGHASASLRRRAQRLARRLSSSAAS